MVRGGSTVVEHSPHQPEVEGSSPAAKKIRLSKYIVLKYGEVSTIIMTLDGIADPGQKLARSIPC